MKAGKIKSLLLTIFGCFYAIFAYSATSLFSDYGQIQNVQNYSTNPFWTPNSPYNQKMPQPVYVQGTAISNDECVKVLQSAVAMQCMARDNCKNTSLADIRPAVVVQLSNLPNKAYSTACIGYLDTVYESYVAQYGNNAPTGRVNFPNATTPNPSLNNNNAPIIPNPYEIKTPKWQQEINERSQELQRLQSQTNSVNTGLTATAFPTTYADLSFTERMANETEGYAPYKGTTAYRTINVTYNTAEWCKEHDGPECDEYYCQKGGPKANEPACITYRCSKPEYANNNQEECICAEKGKTSFECMNYRCNQSDDFGKSTECHKWKCENDTGYKTQHKDICSSTPKQPPIPCEKTNSDCINRLCKLETFKDEHKDLCDEGSPKDGEKTEVVSLCPKVLYHSNYVSKFFVNRDNSDGIIFTKGNSIIQTANIDVAKILAKELLKCTEQGEGYEYSKKDSANNDVYLVYTKKGFDDMHIYFDDITNANTKDNIGHLFGALCLIAGATRTLSLIPTGQQGMSVEPKFRCDFKDSVNKKISDIIKDKYNTIIKEFIAETNLSQYTLNTCEWKETVLTCWH